MMTESTLIPDLSTPFLTYTMTPSLTKEDFRRFPCICPVGLVMVVVLAGGGALTRQAKVLVDNELANARVTGGNYGEAHNDG